MQHADHFTRILNEKENFKKEKIIENKEGRSTAPVSNIQLGSDEKSEDDIMENSEQSKINKNDKSQVEAS